VNRPNPYYLVHQSDLDRIDGILGLVHRFITELIASRQLPDIPDQPEGYDEFEAYIERLAAETDEERQMEFRWMGRGLIDV
jgi:hypothetical protein